MKAFRTGGPGNHERPWLRALAVVALVLFAYFLAPLAPREQTGVFGVLRAVGLALALIIMARVVFRLVRPAVAEDWDLRARLAALVVLVAVVAVAFAAVAVLMSEQFDGLETKVDGLYFALVTLTTVGFGDIVPVGQTARAVVTVQVAFDLVVVTTAVSILSRGRPHATEDS